MNAQTLAELAIIRKEKQKYFDEGYIKALTDLWVIAISKFDEGLDFNDLADCIKELKKVNDMKNE